MIALLYTSTLNERYSPIVVKDIQHIAQEKNSQYGITGYLYFENNRFLQYLEGPEKSIKQLMTNLSSDERHAIHTHIVQEALNERRFPNWSMKIIERCNESKNNISLENILAMQLARITKSHIDNHQMPKHTQYCFEMAEKISQGFYADD